MAPPQKLFLAAIVFTVIVTATTGHGRHVNGAADIVRSSCEHASYPLLCVRTLSSYSGPTITNRRDLALAAVKVSLSRTQSVAKKLVEVNDTVGEKSMEKQSLHLCVEMIDEAVDRLSETISALKQIPVSGGSAEEFHWHLDSAQSWASAAFTDFSTCIDGFDEDAQTLATDSEIKTEVKQWMTKLERLTSNALYMIVQLDETRAKPPVVHL